MLADRGAAEVASGGRGCTAGRSICPHVRSHRERKGRKMNRILLGVVGAVLLVAGVVFALQGFNALKGSAMSGSNTWATAGPIIAAAGLVLLLAATFMGHHRHSPHR